jgi:DNA-binding GntR family transcriptional regulator
MKVSQSQSKEDVSQILPVSLTKFVFDYLTKEIVEERLKPGDRLVPEELAGHLKVSKSPVREALVALEREGLVKNMPRVGFYVSEIKFEDIEEIYPIRASLNALVIGSIIKAGLEPDTIATLRKMLRSMKERVKAQDTDKYFSLHVQFYDFLMEICPNQRLTRILGQLGVQVLRFRHLTMSKPGHIQHSLENHEKLVNAMEQDDVKTAEHMAKSTIYECLEVLRELYGRDDSRIS